MVPFPVELCQLEIKARFDFFHSNLFKYVFIYFSLFEWLLSLKFPARCWTELKTYLFALLLTLWGSPSGCLTSQARCSSVCFSVLSAADWTQSLKQFSMWAPGLLPSLSDFGKCSLSEWRHHFPTSLTFSMIHLVKRLVYTDMISWAWWCMHLDLGYLETKAEGQSS